MKNIIYLFFIIILIFSCAKKETEIQVKEEREIEVKKAEITIDDILESDAIKLELELLKKIEDISLNNYAENEVKMNFTEIGNKFTIIKKYFEEINSKDNKINEIKELQINLSNVYINMKDKIEKGDDISIVYLELLKAESYYNRFLDILKGELENNE